MYATLYTNFGILPDAINNQDVVSMFQLFTALEKYHDEKDTIQNDLNFNNMTREQQDFYRDLI